MTRTFAYAAATAVFFACPAWAKYPQCAGNPEFAKCEKMWDEIASETPAKKAERAKRFAESKQEADKAVAAQPNYKHLPTYQHAPAIGMSVSEALESTWGRPTDINRTTTASTVREQWVYSSQRYLYFTNGRLTTIQD